MGTGSEGYDKWNANKSKQVSFAVETNVDYKNLGRLKLVEPRLQFIERTPPSLFVDLLCLANQGLGRPTP